MFELEGHLRVICTCEDMYYMPIFSPLLFPQLLPEVVQTLQPQAAEGELQLSHGDLVYVINKPASGSGQWLGVAPDGTLGYFKSDFIRPVDPKEVQ